MPYADLAADPLTQHVWVLKAGGRDPVTKTDKTLYFSTGFVPGWDASLGDLLPALQTPSWDTRLRELGRIRPEGLLETTVRGFELRNDAGSLDAYRDYVYEGYAWTLYHGGSRPGEELSWAGYGQPLKGVFERGATFTDEKAFLPARDAAGLIYNKTVATRRFRFRGTGVALLFDGTNDYAEPAATWAPTGSFTAQVLAFVPASAANLAAPVYLIDTGAWRLELAAWDGAARTTRFAFRLNSMSGSPVALSPTLTQTEVFYWVTAVFDDAGDLARCYLDGVAGADVAATGSITTSAAMVFGADVAKAANFYAGVACEWRGWGKALDEDEVADSIEGPVAADETNLDRYWPGEVDSATGTKLLELVHQNVVAETSPYDATITGALEAHSLGGEEDLRGEPMPTNIGYIENATPRLVGPQDLIYQLGADTESVTALGEVYVDGVELTHQQTVQTLADLFTTTVQAGKYLHYPFHGGLVRLNALTGEVTCSYWMGGPFARAWRFLGATQQIDHGTALNSLFAASFSVEFWFIYFQKVGAQILYDCDDTVASRGISIGVTNTSNTWGISLKLYTGGTRFTTYVPVRPNEAHHLAWTVDTTGGDVVSKLYLNGRLVVTDTHTSETLAAASAATLYAGRSSLANDKHLDGVIGETRFWSDVRTQTEIRENMLRTIDPAEASLFAYFRGNDDANLSNWIDYTTNGNHGTSTFGLLVGGVGYRTAPQACYRLLTDRGGATAAQIDLANDKFWNLEDPIAYHEAEERRIGEAIEQLLQGADGKGGFRPDGLFRIFTILDLDAETAVSAIGEHLIGNPRRVTRFPPLRSWREGYRPNWTVQRADALPTAGVGARWRAFIGEAIRYFTRSRSSVLKSYPQAEAAAPVDGLFLLRASAAAAAKTRRSVYGRVAELWEVPLIAPLLVYDPGTVHTVSHPYGTLAGGPKAQILGHEARDGRSVLLVRIMP